jgi:hypothetical protein
MPRNDLADYLDHDSFLEEATKPKPKRSEQTEQDKQEGDILRRVSEGFPNARIVTREDYRRGRTRRIRQGHPLRTRPEAKRLPALAHDPP